MPRFMGLMATLIVSHILLLADSHSGPLLRTFTPEEIHRKWAHAVVKISAYQGGKQVSVGTGFFISAEGHLVTNLHVLQFIFRPEYQFEISLFNGQRLPRVELLHCSDHRLIDLCLLRAPLRPKLWFKIAPTTPTIGQEVYKIGHGANQDFNLTMGDTVEREQNIPFLLNYRYQENREVDFIEVSAPIFPGDSGGPIFNRHGEVLGMTTLMLYEQKGSMSEVRERGMGISVKEVALFMENWKKKSEGQGGMNKQIFPLLTLDQLQRLRELEKRMEGPPELLAGTQMVQLSDVVRLVQDESVVIIDVRDPRSFHYDGHLPRALNAYYKEKSRQHRDYLMAQDEFPYDKLKKRVTGKIEVKGVLFYAEDSSSWTAYKAARWARDHNLHEKIYWYKEGWREWRQSLRRSRGRSTPINLPGMKAKIK